MYNSVNLIGFHTNMEGNFEDQYNLSRYRERQRKSAELEKQVIDPDSGCKTNQV
jgi:hypothetical protein